MVQWKVVTSWHQDPECCCLVGFIIRSIGSTSQSSKVDGFFYARQHNSAITGVRCRWPWRPFRLGNVIREFASLPR